MPPQRSLRDRLRALRARRHARRAQPKGRLRRALSRYRLLRDVVAALLIVVVLVGALATWTGGVWPPVLAVESGSMMHSDFETPYGRVGTIDVGDLVFLRAIDGPQDVALWVDGGEARFGQPGDVVAYAEDGNRPADDGRPQNLTIIHRAITWIEVARTPDGAPAYEVRWLDGETRRFGPDGVYFPPLGFDERFGFSPTNGYRPLYSGFVTKGDNAFTNPAVDQALGISQLVHPTWIEGEVYGEVPWLGLPKLALQMGQTNPAVAGWERLGNAYAPIEQWSMLLLVVTIVLLVPFAIGTWRLLRDQRAARVAFDEAERERRADDAKARAEEARRPPPAARPIPLSKPPPAAPRRVASFTPVKRE